MLFPDKVLLDTNGYRALRDGDASVLETIEEAQVVYVSTIVLGEILVGFALGNREQKNRKILSLFLEQPTVRLLPVTKTTADFYAQVKVGLQKKGKPIPLNDVWIAAQAMETGSTLLTFDQHFEHVGGLKLWQK